ncbi:MAG: FAD-dependent monooxygenase [Actinomycetota bacterium]|nr:FAD-dependent monooxygenase [Actinomycetota bacterium]
MAASDAIALILALSNPSTANRLRAASRIVVVGAGPAGLAAAVTLAAAGIDHLVLDQQAESANTSRAAVVHARTLEVLDELGVTADLRAAEPVPVHPDGAAGRHGGGAAGQAACAGQRRATALRGGRDR